RIAIDGGTNGGIGHARVDVGLDPPRDYLRPAAWKRLPRRAIQRGRITVDGGDLRQLAISAGQVPRADGRVDAELTLTRTGSHGTVRARGITAARLPAPLDLALHIDRKDSRIVDLQLDAGLRGLVAGTASARVQIPERPFDPAGWARMDADNLHSATVVIPDVRIDDRLSRRLRLHDRWHGRASLALEVGAGMRDALVQIEVHRLRGKPLRAPVELALTVRAGHAGIEVDASAGGNGALITGEAHVPVPMDALWERGAPALRRAPLTGKVELQPTPVGRLLGLASGREQLVGTVAATATIGGTVDAPTGRAVMMLRDVGVRRPTLQRLTATAIWDGARLRARVRGTQYDGGRLAVDTALDPADPATAKGTLVAHRFDVGPLALLGPARLATVEGRLGGELRVTGLGRDTAVIDGDLRMTEAHLPIDSRIGTLRHGTVRLSARNGRFQLGVDGRIGDGTLSLHAAGSARGLVPEQARIDGALHNVVLLAEVQPRVDAALHATVRRAGDGLVIEGEVRNGRIAVPKLGARPLYQPGTPHDMIIIANGVPPPRTVKPVPPWRALLGTRPSHPWLHLNLAIRPMVVQTGELRALLSGRLRVQAGDDGLLVGGGLSIAEGSIVLFDRRYRVERAELSFNGGADPVVDVRLIHDFPGMTLYITVTGPLKDPHMQLASQPASYSEGQLLAVLLGANPGQEGSPELEDAATGLAASILSKKLGGYVEGYLPVELDVLRFKTATATEAASLTVGKWITRKLFLAYERRLEARPDQNAGQGEVEYWLRPDLLLEAQVGDRGHHDLDLLWLDRW
ncbi:MAG TPA: translocation/assembly module TamB domain-containing protein, partial [Kofleriaceae bacterium]|nr:translocation/assembly module TamB domain-containing protein [Kofleriaceae bacterium]